MNDDLDPGPSGEYGPSFEAPDYKKSGLTERFGTALVIVLKFAHRSHRIHTVVSLRIFKSSVPQLFAFLRLS